MAKANLPFGEWRPDLALLDNQFANVADNVFPGLNSYKPLPSLLPFTAQSLVTGGGNDSFTKALLHCDGTDASTTFSDSNIGGSAHTWTANGNAQIDTADSKFGGASGLFDGTGDWVSTPDHADFTLGSGDFTIDLWFKVNAAGGTQLFLAGQEDGAQTPALTAWNLQRSSGNVIRFQLSNGSVFTNIDGTTQFTNAVNTGWHHVAAIRTGNILRLFIDGTQEGSDGAFSSTVQDSAQSLKVGDAIAANSWNGWIDEFRLSIGVARWTSAFTPPPGPYFLGGKCVGLTAARRLDGTWRIYAGTQTGLFLFDASGWINVSRITGGNYNVPNGELWSFTQFGTNLVAVNINDDPQVIDIEAGANFAALGGSPPRAHNVKQIGDFLVLGGLASNPRKIRWSSINNITSWTTTNLGDEQEFPDGGPVMGIAGNEIGFIVQDRSIRLMQFLPGDVVYVFQFSRVVKDRGCVSEFAFGSVADTLYFLAEDGFYSLAGSTLNPIGHGKVNDWFIANSDLGRRNLVQFIEGNKPFVAWAFYSSSAPSFYDRLIIYNWADQRWATATLNAQIYAALASTGLDLDTTGSEPGDALLDSTALPLDSFAYVGGRPLVCGIDPQGLLGSLAGPNLSATMETAEAHLVPGMRAYVSDVYPLVDGDTAAVSVSTRERLGDAAVWSTPLPLEVTGSVSVLSSSRLHRFRVNVDAGDQWTNAQGVLAEAEPDGMA